MAEEELGFAFDTDEDNKDGWTPLKSRQLQSLISYNPSVIGRSPVLQTPQLRSLISYNPSAQSPITPYRPSTQSSLVPYTPYVIGKQSARLNQNIGRVSASVVPLTVAIERVTRPDRIPWGKNTRSLEPRQNSALRTALNLDLPRLPNQSLNDKFDFVND